MTERPKQRTKEEKAAYQRWYRKQRKLNSGGPLTARTSKIRSGKIRTLSDD